MEYAPYPHTSPSPAPTPKRPQPKGWGKLWAAFGLGVLAFLVLVGVEAAGTVADYVVEIDQNALLATAELAGGLTALLSVAALGGKRIARPSLKGMGEAWIAASWLFLADGIFVAVEIAEVALGIEQIDLAPDWPARMGVLALLCFGVGLMEECSLRGLCLNGLLARMGRTRGGVYGAVILSSLAFGLLHFDFLIDFGDPLQVAQNCMKVLQTGMCGFLFAAILVKTRNLWALACIHAANDFMLLFMSNGLTDADVATEYVQTGSDGVAILLLYCVLCTLYLPFLFVGKRLIDQASPWRGDFYRYPGDTRGNPGGTREPQGAPAAVQGMLQPVPAPQPAPVPVAQPVPAPQLAPVPAPQPAPVAAQAQGTHGAARQAPPTPGIPVAQAVRPAPGEPYHKAYRGKHARIDGAPARETQRPTTPQGETHD